ncbi:lipase maturation factor family protein [Puia sp. P3]|uniref:lipase maturation factor family protein n=1 Tax=Puia sp. P3 TaxID=3423952 RepID=UPI003D675C68
MVYGTEGGQPTYWLTRFVILRLLGLVYAVAFLAAINQIIPLIGSDGLLPVGTFLRRVSGTLGSAGAGFRRLPSLFWLVHSDTALLTTAWVGLILSCILLAGYANALVMTVLWFLYMSIVHVGQDWYGYGWEIQLLETGFLAIFLCPLLDPRPFPRMPPPLQIIILFRWLIFRIMVGSGMIKLRGDETWTNRTALYYHFETQPMPGPFSRWFHFLPRWTLQVGVWFNWLAELVAPWFVFWPRIGRHIAGCVIILLQVILILSGNLSFLNWLTIVPALACFDDGWWARVLPRRLVRMAEQAQARAAEPGRDAGAVIWSVTVIVVLLSVEPALNILSSRQIMNTSYDPLDLVNTYGAFGSVGRERLNVVFEGADDTTGVWKPYPYKGLPADPDKRPPQIAPYHLRLDWQMWFAAMATPEEYAWTYHLVWKLLHNDPGALRLFAGNPFPDRPPRYIRAILYRYSFVRSGHWWRREQVGNPWIPPMSTDNPKLREILNVEEWLSGSVGVEGCLPGSVGSANIIIFDPYLKPSICDLSIPVCLPYCSQYPFSSVASAPASIRLRRKRPISTTPCTPGRCAPSRPARTTTLS